MKANGKPETVEIFAFYSPMLIQCEPATSCDLRLYSSLQTMCGKYSGTRSDDA